MIRATTGGVLKSYRSNLMNSFISMNKARDTVLTQRNFNSYAEDPAAAAKAFRLRKSRMEVGAQYDICSDAYKKFQSAWSCLDTIDDILDTETASPMNTISGMTLKMLNDPTGDARTQLSKALDQMAQSIVQTMNQKYGDTFLFAGADGHNVPFEVRDDGKLYYRGVPVDAAKPNVVSNDGAFLTMNQNGEYDTTVTGDDVYYLKRDNVTILSKDEYEKLYVLPAVDMGGGTDPVEYNEDGTVYGAGGYYQKTDGSGWISIEDYGKADPKPQLVVDADQNPIECNPDGTPRGQGGFYKTDPAGDMITVSEYNGIVTRAKNPPHLLQDAATGQPLDVDENGLPGGAGGYVLIVQGEPSEQVMSKADYDAAVKDADKLNYLMTQEKLFVDIGLGFQENEKGELIQSSGFNAALHGLTFIGYGLDEDGDPKNVYSIVQRLREIAESVPNGGDWDEDIYNEFDGLVSKLEKASSNFKTEFTNMDAGTTKLKNNVALLEDNFYNLQEQYSDLEDVDMVDSITSFIWAQYCYNAALKVGNNVLSESLMDYLN